MLSLPAQRSFYSCPRNAEISCSIAYHYVVEAQAPLHHHVPLSPQNKESNEATNSDFSDVFPPSRRFTLASVAPHVVAKYPNPDSGLLQAMGEKKPIRAPLDVPFVDWDPKSLTPTEFSKEEIEALGDFPDYAALSGVPLPQAYEEFVVEKAKPRPYRPLRWAYHQTMCKFCCESQV